tara:strand:+ start:134 stop:775 length:642 start_codon:yes stop_codon:yes gene_type:complete
MSKLIKSNQRVSDHGEVFTSDREVNAMLDLVKQETERIDSRFLEPACGSGNFLVEILNRKLKIVKDRYKKSQIEFERNSIIAISSIYGVDILQDNVIECRDRLFEIFDGIYTRLYKTHCKEDCRASVKFLLKRNILWGDALDFTNPETKEPIVFSEWSAINGNMIKRRDYVFKFLVEQTHQYSMFNDEGNPASIDEPIKNYPLINYLKISESD